MRVNERRVCAGVMPLRPVVGFLRPRSRSRRTCSIRPECRSRKASMPCRTGSRWTPNRLNSRSAKLSWESRVRLISGSERLGISGVLWPEQLVVDFTDALQGGLEFAVIAQPLLDEGLLLGGEADYMVYTEEGPVIHVTAVLTEFRALGLFDAAYEFRTSD